MICSVGPHSLIVNLACLICIYYFLFTYLIVEKVELSNKKGGCLLQPPTPIVRAGNWPAVEVQKTTLEDLEAAAVEEDEVDDNKDDFEANQQTGEQWEVEEFEDTGTGAMAAAMDDLDIEDEDDGMGDWDDDLDLGDDMAETVPEEAEEDDMAVMSDMRDTEGFQMPKSGRPATACWTSNSHAAVHVAAGAVSSGLQYLNRQIAVSDFSKLRPAMIGSYIGSHMSMPGVPGSVSLNLPLLQNDANGHPGETSLPRSSMKIKGLIGGVRSGYRFFQTGKFNDAKEAFVSVLVDIPLVMTESKQEGLEIKEMLEICREYITAIRIKAAMSEAASDPVRSTELSAYFTHCNLQPVHLLLALRSAMGTAFKHKNFISAASFARRMLELPDMSNERNAGLRVKVIFC